MKPFIFRRTRHGKPLGRLGRFQLPTSVRAMRAPGPPMTAQKRLAEMDETYCVVLLGGKTRIFAWESSSIYPGSKVPAFFGKSDLLIYFENQRITIQDAEGNQTIKPIFPFWMSRQQSPRAKGLILEPSRDRFIGDKLNLWSGFGFNAEPGDWTLLRRHIETVICNNDPASIDYLFKWIAWTLQNPTKPAEVAIVMRGKKGTGKGTLAARVMLPIFASHGLHISNREHLTGRFNSHLMHCCFIFMDEAIWPGDKAGEGILKRIVTERTLTCEAKGIDAMETLNLLSIMMASNEDWVVPATGDERRFAVFDVAETFRGNNAYFEALFEEIKNGGAQAFLHDMFAVDLGRWHPRQGVPQTAGLARQKMESAGPEIAWLWAILDAGELPDAIRDEAGEKVAVRDYKDPSRAHAARLYLHFKVADSRLRFWTAIKLGKFLTQFGVTRKSDGRTKFLAFPPLTEMRARFLELYPWHEPFNKEEGNATWGLRYQAFVSEDMTGLPESEGP